MLERNLANSKIKIVKNEIYLDSYLICFNFFKNNPYIIDNSH